MVPADARGAYVADPRRVSMLNLPAALRGRVDQNV
jgi:hypothetical protein